MADRRYELVEHRKAMGYSQERLAERLGVEPSTVARWERGETEPQPWHRPRLARALSISTAELYRLLNECAGADAFIAELKRWRDVRSVSQTKLARDMRYDCSYLSKVESGAERPSGDFAAKADEVLQAGGAIKKAHRETEQHRMHSSDDDRQPPIEQEPGSSLLVEHDEAELSYDGRIYRATMRRKLLNCGEEPITRYLIRLSVDRYPGSPERSNELYRNDPLTWDELHLEAWNNDEPMTWQVRHDRDAFKELWLLFENTEARFPLYPGESTEIVYSYTVSDIKWGQWFQRAVRLPTRRLCVRLDFPAALGATVWGMETSMSAEAQPFRTPIRRTGDGERTRFAWTTEDPPLHARYRLEWRFKQPAAPRADAADKKPSETMAELGIVQVDDALLRQQARPFALPDEAEDARRVVAELQSAIERVAQVHVFGKGIGIAAPQIGIGRAAAVVRAPGGEIITLLNPQIIDQSDEQDEQYEGCLSFFDVRGKVPRPLCIQVEHQHVDGSTHITVFERGVARLVAHEIDHLAGMLYTDRIADSASTIPVEQYRGGGQSWHYP